MIHGILYDNQIPTGKDLRSLFACLLSDGIIQGCEISYSGRTVNIADGRLIGCGGAFQIVGGESIAVTGSSGFARVKGKINLTGAATETSFAQVSLAVDYAATEDGFASLTHEDINGSGTVYEFEICVVSLGSSGITSVIRTQKAGAKLNYGSELPTGAPDGATFVVIE